MSQYSPYAAQIADEIELLRARIGVKVARLWRKQPQLFGRPPDADVRRAVRMGLAALLDPTPAKVPSADDHDAAEAFLDEMCWLHTIKQHFSDERQALASLTNSLLTSPKRKYWRHAMQLPKFATPELYQAVLRTSLWACFVNWPEDDQT